MNKLQGLCDEHGAPYNKEPATQRRVMATRLAAKFREDWDKKMARLLETDVLDDDVESNMLAQISFLQRMVPQWFMTLFPSTSGGAIEQGVAKEVQIIHVLQQKVKEMSKGEYDIYGKVREFGLLANRDHPYCASSTDGVFALTKRNNEGAFDFLSLCALEMKTCGTEKTTDALH